MYSLMHLGGVDWEKEFAAQEQVNVPSEVTEEQQKQRPQTDEEKDALARTAAQLLDSVDADNNPRFKNSNFMSLMRKLRDKQVSIEDNKMVESSTAGGDWASEFGQRYDGPGASNSKDWTEDFLKHSDAAKGSMWTHEFARKSERGWTEDFDMAHNHGESTSARPPAAAWANQFSREANTAMGEAEAKELFGKGSEMEDWVQQYQENIAHMKNAQDSQWDNMQKDWERVQPDGMGYRATNPEYDTYNFMTDNPYLMNPQAIDQVEHSTLADSILALEAKAQLQMSDAGAWQQLGFRQQENERDGAAIAALRRAVGMDPTLLDGWLALAVSYTNENCRADAYEALEQWIANNEKYRHLLDGKAKMPANDRHAYITNMFLDAARSSPGAEMDADVQVGLGILFNVSEEYPKAIDCFKAALQSRPQVGYTKHEAVSEDTHTKTLL